MQITVQSPVIIIPDLKSEANYFLLDFGTVEVSSKVHLKPGRWVNYPDKLIYETSTLLVN